MCHSSGCVSSGSCEDEAFLLPVVPLRETSALHMQPVWFLFVFVYSNLTNAPQFLISASCMYTGTGKVLLKKSCFCIDTLEDICTQSCTFCPRLPDAREEFDRMNESQISEGRFQNQN